MRKALSLSQSSLVQLVVDLGLIPKLDLLFRQPALSLRWDSAWALTNITAASSDNVETLRRLGTQWTALAYIKDPNIELKEQVRLPKSQLRRFGS